jgi:hypothetical protein
MKKNIFVLLLFVITACSGAEYPAGTPTPTPNPGEIALQMVQQKVAAESTQMAIGLQFTATAQVIGMTVTSQAIGTAEAITQQARVDAQATADQHRADAQATQYRADMDAKATQQRIDADATQAQAQRDAQATADQARLDMQGTQSANATSTFAVMTLTAIPPHATMTQIAIDNQIIVNNQNVEKAALELQQAREMNNNWKIYLLLGVVMFGAGLLWVVRKSRWNPFIDEDGKLLGFGHDDKYINPRLLTGPVLDLNTGEVKEPTPEQRKVTERAQIIEALAAMPENPSAAGAAVFNKYFGEAPAKSYDVIEGNVLPPVGLLDPEALKSIEKDWQEANDG